MTVTTHSFIEIISVCFEVKTKIFIESTPFNHFNHSPTLPKPKLDIKAIILPLKARFLSLELHFLVFPIHKIQEAATYAD